MPPKRKPKPNLPAKEILTTTDNDDTISKKKSKNSITTDDQSSTIDKNTFRHLTMLEEGHVDFVYGDANEDEEEIVDKKNKTVKQPIYLILTPRGTKDRASKRRLIFIKTHIKEDGPYQVRIENMANTGTSSETSVINQNTVEVEGQAAVGKILFILHEPFVFFSCISNYSILYDTETNNTHFVYILTDGQLTSDGNKQNSFTIEIQNHEEYEKKMLQKCRGNLWLYVHPEMIVFDEGIQMIFTQNSKELVEQHAQLVSSPCTSDLNEYEKLWKMVNDHFKPTPEFQNLAIPGVSEHDLRQAEKRLGNILLPDDMKCALRIHDGRSKFGFGLHYRSPTTDLLLLNEWYPYESEQWCNQLFEEVANGKPSESMKEDLKEHLKVYDGKEGNMKKKEFKELKTELLVIGEGMDDYCEQYLLGLRSGTIYLQILNLPDWNKIGTFKDWVQMALGNQEEED